MCPVLDLNPVLRPAADITPVPPFRDYALKAHSAGRRKKCWADLANSEGRDEDALGTPVQKSRQMRLAHLQRQGPEIVTVEREAVKGIQLHLVIDLAGMQRVEVRDAVYTEDHGFAVDDGLLLAVLERRLGDPRIAAGPVVPVAREQPYPIAVALHAQAVGRRRRSSGRLGSISWLQATDMMPIWFAVFDVEVVTGHERKWQPQAKFPQLINGLSALRASLARPARASAVSRSNCDDLLQLVRHLLRY